MDVRSQIHGKESLLYDEMALLHKHRIEANKPPPDVIEEEGIEHEFISPVTCLEEDTQQIDTLLLHHKFGFSMASVMTMQRHLCENLMRAGRAGGVYIGEEVFLEDFLSENDIPPGSCYYRWKALNSEKQVRP